MLSELFRFYFIVLDIFLNLTTSQGKTIDNVLAITLVMASFRTNTILI